MLLLHSTYYNKRGKKSRNAAVHLGQADRKKVRDVELRNFSRQLLSMVRLFHANRSQVLGGPEKHFWFHFFLLQFSALFRHLGKSHLNCGKSFLPRSLVGQWDKLVAVCRQSWTPLVIKRPLLSTKQPGTATGARCLICNYLFDRFAHIHRFAIYQCA